MDYRKDVEQDAIDFILSNPDMFREGLIHGAEFDRNEMAGLDEAFHERIVDRGYTLVDAAYVLEQSENPEADSGIWEGQEIEDGLRSKAAYSYGNDVWFRIEALYGEMREQFEAQQEGLDEEQQRLGDKLTLGQPLQAEEKTRLADLWDDQGVVEMAADATLAWFKDTYDHVELVQQGSDEERRLIQEWLDLGSRASWWNGYPLGGSYIDARCGVGYSMPDVKDFVDFDHELARRAPHLVGKSREEILAYCAGTP